MVYLIFARQKRDKALRVLFFYIIYSFLNDQLVLNLSGTTLDDKTTFLLNSLFTIVEYSLFSFFIYLSISRKIFKILIMIASLGFLVFAIRDFFTHKENPIFDSLPASIESILILIYCIFYFFDQLNKPTITFLYQTPTFWLVLGLMVYTAGTFFLFLQAADAPREVINRFWTINLICNILKNIFLSIGFVVQKAPGNFNGTGTGFDKRFSEDIFDRPYTHHHNPNP